MQKASARKVKLIFIKHEGIVFVKNKGTKAKPNAANKIRCHPAFASSDKFYA